METTMTNINSKRDWRGDVNLILARMAFDTARGWGLIVASMNERGAGQGPFYLIAVQKRREQLEIALHHLEAAKTGMSIA
jgi:hypothetical protein